MAESTLTAIMGRVSAYTGQEISWELVLNAPLRLGPREYSFGKVEVDPVPVPGKTKLPEAPPAGMTDAQEIG